MNDKRKDTLSLACVLTVCLIVLLILGAVASELFIYSSVGVGGKPQGEFLTVPELVGRSLSEACEILSGLGIEYEIIPTGSGVSNRVENVKFSGAMLAGEMTVLKGTSVTLCANEVGADKVIYLTFDDGPTRDNTDYILDTLDRYGIKATFFLQGKNIERYPEKTLDTVRRGHLVACHSYSHELDEIYGGVDNMLAEIDRYESALRSAIGDSFYESIPQKMFRFPGGSSQNGRLDKAEAREYIDAIRKKGYAIYDWTSLTGDAEGTTTLDGMIEKMEKGLASSASRELPLIVLMHDKWAVKEDDALSKMIEHLISEGYYFDTLDHCPEYTFAEH